MSSRAVRELEKQLMNLTVGLSRIRISSRSLGCRRWS